MIRVGLVDFDTSHVVAFTQRMNHLDLPESEWVRGATVVAGCPGESAMMPERIPGYADTLAKYGIELVGRPEDLLGRIDAVMIESQQGSRHLARARPFLEAGLPTFVDKPLAETVEDATAMIALARQHRAPLLSCSALRYDPQVAAALERRNDLGRILSADVWTAAALHPGNPGLLHYGIHGVEVLFALMGRGCRSVQAAGTDRGDMTLGLWESGHVGSVRGLREGQYGFGAAVHYEKGNEVLAIEGSAFYRELLKVFITMCETGQPPLDYDEMPDVIAFCAAAVASQRAGGLAVEVAG
jgi:predicted dehydrogenase